MVKEGIHPNYGKAVVTFETGSTVPELRVEICSKCHPFYTGQQRTQAARGRIEQFNKRYGKKG